MLKLQLDRDEELLIDGVIRVRLVGRRNSRPRGGFVTIDAPKHVSIRRIKRSRLPARASQSGS